MAFSMVVCYPAGRTGQEEGCRQQMRLRRAAARSSNHCLQTWEFSKEVCLLFAI